MASFKFIMRGMDEIFQELDRYADIADDILDEALDKSADLVLDYMVNKVPVSQFPIKHIKNAIQKSNVIKDGTAKYIYIGVSWNGNIEGMSNDDWAFYVIHLEYGTSKMGAQPFVFPAYNRNKRKILNLMKDIFKRRMNL